MNPFVITKIGVSAVINRVTGSVDAIVRTVEESRAIVTDLLERFHAHPNAASGYRWVVEVTAADLDVDRGPYAPRIDGFTICGLPDDHVEYVNYAFYVRRATTGNQWVVKRASYCYTPDGRYEVLLLDQGPAEAPDFYMDLNTALTVADRLARAYTVRGRTAEDVLAAGRPGAAA